jgi:23S rRNA (cytidine1920-2'-O)/16S rRNA (cytidine1409-2'-O)-methyltransferase
MAGNVLVNGVPMEKPGFQVSFTDDIIMRGTDMPYVSRGGVKLESALTRFQVDPTGLVCLDVGASTGGFTDCLLQYGARSVYAVDVGYGQLAWKLRNDPRVVVIERSNIRNLPEKAVSGPVDLAAIDVSFISLKIVVPSIFRFLKPRAIILALIKPQFEVGKGKVGKGGVVRDPVIHESVLDELSGFFSDQGLTVQSIVPSPISGPKGNKEFFVHMLYPGPY